MRAGKILAQYLPFAVSSVSRGASMLYCPYYDRRDNAFFAMGEHNMFAYLDEGYCLDSIANDVYYSAFVV